ncbi:hypothetical protein SAMN06265379_10455 [Saccharicrinis carchari]|uniref:Lipoprotein n=1 Tax=Saccharicrinis carchari TaxID=1168039 RepID=A0A521CYX5_SACCC|nr:hypothetical protein [Saccharicrinis carchari]SMO64647.1 hypothetical protein SAMN06265379_10455 [Saccharicrinis carchari]
MKPFIGLIFLLFITVSCEKDNNHSNLIIDKLPMEVGTTWVYDWVTITQHLESYNSNKVVKIDTTRMKSTTWIEKDTILFDTLDVKVFRFEILNDGFKESTKSFRYLSTEGLWEVFYYTIDDIIHTHFFKHIALPLSRKSKWSSYENSDGGFKKVVSHMDFELNGKKYECFKIESLHSDSYIDNGYSCYSEIGLVKEYFSKKSSSSLTYGGSDNSHPVIVDTYITLVDFY